MMTAWISGIKCGCELTYEQECAATSGSYGGDVDCPVCGLKDSISTEYETEYDLEPVEDDD